MCQDGGSWNLLGEGGDISDNVFTKWKEITEEESILIENPRGISKCVYYICACSCDLVVYFPCGCEQRFPSVPRDIKSVHCENIAMIGVKRLRLG
jgi:hypothetical protein